MYNFAKDQPTSNAFDLIFPDYSNITKLDYQYIKQTPYEEDSVSTSLIPKL